MNQRGSVSTGLQIGAAMFGMYALYGLHPWTIAVNVAVFIIRCVFIWRTTV